MSDLFLNPPPWPVILALSLLACVLFMAAAVLVALIPPRRTSLMSFLAPYRKALIALIVGAVTTFLASKHIDLNQSLESGIGGLVTAVLVYLVPNKPTTPPAG